jgi:hypothetical protein
VVPAWGPMVMRSAPLLPRTLVQSPVEPKTPEPSTTPGSVTRALPVAAQLVPPPPVVVVVVDASVVVVVDGPDVVVLDGVVVVVLEGAVVVLVEVVLRVVFSSTETLSESLLAVARSGLASWLRSPTATPILAGRYAAKAERVIRHRYIVECAEIVADRR